MIRRCVAKVKKEWEKQHPLGKYETNILPTFLGRRSKVEEDRR